MKVVIAEKPEVAKDIAEVMLNDMKKEKACYRGTVKGESWAVTSAYGHLLGLCDPEEYDMKYKSWNLSDLPISFRDWRVVPSQEEYKKVRLKAIGSLLKEADEVICAGDPDDEGQLLIDEILDYFQFSGMCWRVFVNDNMPDNIRKEFADLKRNDDYRSLGLAARARQMADKCFGINESRLAGCKLKKSGLAIGRVQTPTLGMCVARDEQIENHVKEKYYELSAMVSVKETPFTFLYKPDKKYLEEIGAKTISDRSFLEAVETALREQENFSVSFTEEEKVTAPPLPYNLTVLQSEMNRRYGYSMSKTLDITQALRGKKAITYNRSDSQYLKEEHYREAPNVLGSVLGGELLQKYPLDFSIHSACFDEKNVTAHHGIIPQNNHVSFDSLTEEERNVYLAICERYAMQFLPPEKRNVSVGSFSFAGTKQEHSFECRLSQVTDAGYTAHFSSGSTATNDSILPPGEYSGAVTETNIAEKESKPPARYTEGSLAKDMASIAKYVTDPEVKAILKKKDAGKKGENGSIGTVATRGAIVNGLIQRGFLETKGKNVVSTKLGREFYHMLPPEISSADITAKWWLLQEAIKEGKETDPNVLQTAVCEEFLRHKDSAYQNQSFSGGNDNTFEVKEKVSGTWNGKEISFTRTWGGHTFTEEECDLLLQGETISFQAVSTKTNKPYTVSGKLSEQKYKKHSFVGFCPDFATKKK